MKQYAANRSIRISEKALKKKAQAHSFLISAGDFTMFWFKSLKQTFSFPFEFNELLRQCFQIGNKSFSLISITGLIMGLVLTIQSRPVLSDFGAEGMLPGMVAVSLIREIGPVITALICAGKIGSGMGAELGSMKVTEQVDAMEVSAVNPVKFLVVTRILAATFMLPLLVLFADAWGLVGGWIGVNIKSSVDIVLYLSHAFHSVEYEDFIPAFIKTFFFGFVIGFVGCYKGLTAGRGTESVGIAANSAVVLSSLLVIVVDLIAVQITDMFLVK